MGEGRGAGEGEGTRAHTCMWCSGVGGGVRGTESTSATSLTVKLLKIKSKQWPLGVGERLTSRGAGAPWTVGFSKQHQGPEASGQTSKTGRKCSENVCQEWRQFQADKDGEPLTSGPTLKKENGRDILQEGENQPWKGATKAADPQKSAIKKIHKSK